MSAGRAVSAVAETLSLICVVMTKEKVERRKPNEQSNMESVMKKTKR